MFTEDGEEGDSRPWCVVAEEGNIIGGNPNPCMAMDPSKAGICEARRDISTEEEGKALDCIPSPEEVDTPSSP